MEYIPHHQPIAHQDGGGEDHHRARGPQHHLVQAPDGGGDKSPPDSNLKLNEMGPQLSPHPNLPPHGLETSAAVTATNNLATNPTNYHQQIEAGKKVSKVQLIIKEMFKQQEKTKYPIRTGMLELDPKPPKPKPKPISNPTPNPTTAHTHAAQPIVQPLAPIPEPQYNPKPTLNQIPNQKTTNTQAIKPTTTPPKPKPNQLYNLKLKPIPKTKTTTTTPALTKELTNQPKLPKPNTLKPILSIQKPKTIKHTPNQEPNQSHKNQHPNPDQAKTTITTPRRLNHPTKNQRTKNERGIPTTRLRKLPKPEEVPTNQPKMTKFVMREEKKRDKERTEDSPTIKETSEGGKNAKTINPTVTIKEPIMKHLEEEKPISVKSRVKEFTAKLSDTHPTTKQENHRPKTPSNSLAKEQNPIQQNGRLPSENLVGHRGISCNMGLRNRDRIGGNVPRGGDSSE